MSAPASSAPPAVLATDSPGSAPCAGCGAALHPSTHPASAGSAVDYRDALCGFYLDSVHRLPSGDSCRACKRTLPVRELGADLGAYVDLDESPVPCIVTRRQMRLGDVVRTWGIAPFGYGQVIVLGEDGILVRWVDPTDGDGDKLYPRSGRGHFLRIDSL